MKVLVLTVVGLPILSSALVLFLALRGARPATVHRATLATVGLTALCGLALLPYAEQGPLVMVEWLPGTGPMGLTINASGLYAALGTTWGGFLILLGTTSRKEEFHPRSGAVTLLALAAAVAAFLADHFLARYVALEVVALCVALAPLVEIRDPAGAHLAWTTYLLLRVGDAGLLAAILILHSSGGTLSIGPALKAGSVLDTVRLGWVAAGFILAVWVKLGGWIFHLWSRAGRRLSLASQAWLYANLVPNLGAYLLYRVTPLLVLAGPLRTVMFWLGAGGAVLAAVIALTETDTRTALVYVGATQGGLALFVAAAGVKPAIWLGLLVLTPLRLLLFLAAPDPEGFPNPLGSRSAAYLFGLGGLALTAFSLLTTWWAREAGGYSNSGEWPGPSSAKSRPAGIWIGRSRSDLSSPGSVEIGICEFKLIERKH